MDEGGGYGHGEDPGEQFHRNEAISAVADEGFLVEEDDDDYEDLYNDVNVGEGFLQSLKRNDDEQVAVSNAEDAERKNDQHQPQQFAAPPPPPAGNVIAEPSGSMVVGRSNVSEGVVEGYGNQGNREPVLPGPPSGGLRVELGQVNRNMGGLVEQNVGQVQGFVQPPLQHPPVSGSGAPGVFQHHQPFSGGDMGNLGNDGFARGGNMNVNGMGANGISNVGGGVGGPAGVGGVGGNAGGGGGTMLFVGDLHWWTTDAELEAELCKYGIVKEIKFFDEKASGKSKGYCQVEFYDPGAAAACKEGMNGHVFNGRPCVVAFASPFSVKRMGEAQVSRTQQTGQTPLNQSKRVSNDNGGKPAGSNISTGGNFQGGGDNSRGGYGRGNWGRGNSQGMGNRGGAPGGMRRGGRGIMGNGGNAFNLGMGGNPHMMHPQAMMAQGFDPAFGGPMGRMGGYGGFPGGPMAPFPGMMLPFHPVGGVGMPGVAPHFNPAFFGRGMPMNGMGMVPTSGMDGPNMGMWQDPSMAGWAAEDHPGRGRESSYGDEVASDPQYGEASQERGATKEKDRVSERDWSGSSDKKHREKRKNLHMTEMCLETRITDLIVVMSTVVGIVMIGMSIAAETESSHGSGSGSGSGTVNESAGANWSGSVPETITKTKGISTLILTGIEIVNLSVMVTEKEDLPPDLTASLIMMTENDAQGQGNPIMRRNADLFNLNFRIHLIGTFVLCGNIFLLFIEIYFLFGLRRGTCFVKIRFVLFIEIYFLFGLRRGTCFVKNTLCWNRTSVQVELI